jgi:opacity protein-like surface antigen
MRNSYRNIALSILLSLCLIYPALAQEPSRQQKLDSLYNDPFFFPTVSSVLLPKGFFEINNFASILSATKLFNSEKDLIDLNGRYSFFVNTLQLTYGVSAKGNFNIGADLGYQAYRFDEDVSSSPFKVFSGDSALIKDRYFNTLSVRFRWKPFERNRNLILQGSISQPLHNVSTSQNSIAARAIYVYQLSRSLFLYGQGGLSYSLKKKDAFGSLSIPLSLIFQYQLKPVFGLVATVGHTPVLGKAIDLNFTQTSFGTQIGGGLQFQPSLGFGLSASYAKYVLGKSTGAFGLYNLGIRVII